MCGLMLKHHHHQKTWLDIISSMFSFYSEQNSVVCAALTIYGRFVIESSQLNKKPEETLQKEKKFDSVCRKVYSNKQTNHQSVAEYLVYTWEQQNSETRDQRPDVNWWTRFKVMAEDTCSKTSWISQPIRGNTETCHQWSGQVTPEGTHSDKVPLW